MRRLAALLLLTACKQGAPSVAPVEGARGAELEPVASAIESTGEDLGPWLAELVREHEVPGLVAMVVGDAGPIASGTAGRRRVDRPERIALSDPVHLGSDTKAMTAMLAARLVDRGLVRWDSTLAELFADTEIAMHEAWREITLEQLLSHRSGAPENALAASALAGVAGGSPAEARVRLARAALSQAPPAPAGEAFVYSNLGYILAGAAIEARVREDWESLLRREIWQPLQMEGCGFGPTADDEAPEGVWGHLPARDGWTPTSIDNPPLLGPAGTVHCPIAAWARFARAQWAEGSEAIVSDAARERLHAGTPTEVDGPVAYALGWLVVTDEAGRTMLTHDGSNTANYATISVFPASHHAVLVACNAGGPAAQAAAQQTRKALIKRYVPEPAPEPERSRTERSSLHVRP